MNHKRWNRILSYVLVALLTMSVTVAVMLGIFTYKRQTGSKLQILEQLIADYFIGEVDHTAMEDAAASAMIAALGDQWSYYISAEQYASYMEQMNNAYVGVGVTITMQEGGGFLVLDVTEGGPAKETGILVDDVIIAVDGQSVLETSVNDSKKLIQGKEGTTVAITVLRAGEEKTITVTRRAIRTPVVKAQLLEDDIGLIAIYNFNSNCAQETIGAIENLLEQGAQKLIFDVRNNPGGYASELVKVLDYLLPEGKLFTTVDYAGNTRTDMSDANCLEIPMAVLVNGNSYSAAEFFAAAMAEYEAAVVVGERTTGKGYFQSTFQLPDGSAVGLSIGKYYTPQGKSLADVGITPDVEVSIGTGQIGSDPLSDPQLAAAIEAMRS